LLLAAYTYLTAFTERCWPIQRHIEIKAWQSSGYRAFCGVMPKSRRRRGAGLSPTEGDPLQVLLAMSKAEEDRELADLAAALYAALPPETAPVLVPETPQETQESDKGTDAGPEAEQAALAPETTTEGPEEETPEDAETDAIVSRAMALTQDD
jgi:hypothetical protein